MPGGPLLSPPGIVFSTRVTPRAVLVDLTGFGAAQPVLATVVEEFRVADALYACAVTFANGDTLRCSPNMVIEIAGLGNVVPLRRPRAAQ
jgi:hypothetical protein